jgi:hypothetical protein
MWEHGIQDPIELLRKHLHSGTVKLTISFIDMAYEMLELVHKDISVFKATWMECLGDVARYCCAIEKHEDRKKKWRNEASSWYIRAAQQLPMVGRLVHHIGIVAEFTGDQALHRAQYFFRSLNCAIVFPRARQSLSCFVLDRILRPETGRHRIPPPLIHAEFLRIHDLLLGGDTKLDRKSTQNLFGQLGIYIARYDANWRRDGIYMACINIAAWFDYGTNENALRQKFLRDFVEMSKDTPLTPEKQASTAVMTDLVPDQPLISEQDLTDEIRTLTEQQSFLEAHHFTAETLAIVLRRTKDENVLPHIHIVLAFCTQIARSPVTSNMLDSMPWSELCVFLNALLICNTPQAQSNNTPLSELVPWFSCSATETRDRFPLPEDYFIQGLVWAGSYFPEGWFAREHGEEERYLEQADTLRRRIDRILFLGLELAKVVL